MSLPSRFLPIALGPVLAVLAAVASAPGCATTGSALADLSANPGAVRAWFEMHREHPRAVLLLSPV